MSIELHIPILSEAGEDSTKFKWIQAANVPVEELCQFSSYPYRWLCYVSYCVTGLKGNLSLSNEDANWVEYDAPNVPEGVGAVYYHYSEEIDEDIPLVELQSTHGGSLISDYIEDPDFRRSVLHRDGERDIVRGVEAPFAEAAHLIKSAKGNKFIQRLTALRRDNGVPNTIENVNDARNGLTVNRYLHKALGKDVALLPTPNFMLNTSHLHANQPPAAPACTIHIFPAPLRTSEALRYDAPHGCRLRLSSSMEKWPPNVLFNYVYGEVFVRNFGTPEFYALCVVDGPSKYYPTQVDIGADGEKLKEADQDNSGRQEREDKQRNPHQDDPRDTQFIRWLLFRRCKPNSTPGLVENEAGTNERVKDWVESQRHRLLLQQDSSSLMDREPGSDTGSNGSEGLE